MAETTAGAVRVVDAPVSGGVEGAEAGTLSIMVGGEDRDVADGWAVLSACGNPVHLGPLGSGQVAKACNQMIVASTILALGEAAVLAERSGLDLTELFRLLGGGYAGSRILESRGDRIIQQDYSPSGVAKYMVKDLDFASAVATATGTHPILPGREGRIRGTHGARTRRQRHRRHDVTSNSAEHAPGMPACVRHRPEPADPPHRFGDREKQQRASTNGSTGESRPHRRLHDLKGMREQSLVPDMSTPASTAS